MQSHIIKRFAVVLIVLLASANVMPAPVIIESRAAHAVKLSAVRDRIAEIRASADRDDGAGLLSSLEQVDGDATLDPAVREYLLETTLLALSRTTPDPVARAAVNHYRGRSITVLVRLHEQRGRTAVPLYDLAAAARLTNRVWDTANAKEQVTIELRAAIWQPGDYLRPSEDMSLEAWQAGTRRAFGSVARRLVTATKSALLLSQSQSHEYDSLLLVAAIRLDDLDLYDAIIMQGDASYAREAIGAVYQTLNSADASSLLINATTRPELASRAILEMGGHAPIAQETRRWLLNRLGNRPDGASAALALARAADDDILEEIQAVILGDATELMKLRAALVLRLSELEAARSLRHELLSRTLTSERLRQALR